jgi:hypothetical protein
MLAGLRCDEEMAVLSEELLNLGSSISYYPEHNPPSGAGGEPGRTGTPGARVRGLETRS